MRDWKYGPAVIQFIKLSVSSWLSTPEQLYTFLHSSMLILDLLFLLSETGSQAAYHRCRESSLCFLLCRKLRSDCNFTWPIILFWFSYTHSSFLCTILQGETLFYQYLFYDVFFILLLNQQCSNSFPMAFSSFHKYFIWVESLCRVDFFPLPFHYNYFLFHFQITSEILFFIWCELKINVWWDDF